MTFTDSFDLYESPHESDCRGMDNIDNIVSEFTNHPSIIKIKERYKFKGSFSFRRITREEIKIYLCQVNFKERNL